ncbi:hypothetical protein [Fodinicola acaciae]|uniref:hypothetical protein n=1 Tax=Fodinicola acaciae TaxID=2681555 RepID=UPI0013D4310A|nr:hypothetical protein [Fodinicola acaciae]
MVSEYSGRDALNQALRRALAADDRVLLLGQDIADPIGGAYGVTGGLSTTYGRHRVVNLPGPVTGMTGVAVGAALEGMVPVVELSVAAIAGPALDQLAHAAALFPGANGYGSPVFRVPMPADALRGGARTRWFALIPGLNVLTPRTPAEAETFLHAAILDPAPCVVVEPVALYDATGPRSAAAPARF